MSRRKAYFYIILITGVFVVHFILYQDLMLIPSPFCSGCMHEVDDRNIIDMMNRFGTKPTSMKNKSPSPKVKEMKYVSSVNAVKEVKRKSIQYRNSPNLHTTVKEVEISHSHSTANGTLSTLMKNTSLSYSRFPVNSSVGSRKTFVFVPPWNEKPIRRFPQCVIIGFAKCGTRALLEFLSLHPYVLNHNAEMHFYDRDDIFRKGFDWYRNQMPLSYSNQITIEKTPAYVLHQRARDEMYKLNPKVKLILLVRDPVVRLVSQFLLRYRDVLPYRDVPVTAIYRHNVTGNFMPDHKPVVVGIYYKHLVMWLQRFSRKQFLILNGEELSANPLPVLKQVESFLGIPPMFEDNNFYYNKSSGFFCPRGFEKDAEPQCLGRLKGLKHPKLPPGDEEMLYDFYRPLNERFFKLANQRFEWKEREWERYQ